MCVCVGGECLVPGLVLVLSYSSLSPFKFGNCLAEEEGTGCLLKLYSLAFMLLFVCVLMYLPHCAKRWSVI